MTATPTDGEGNPPSGDEPDATMIVTHRPPPVGGDAPRTEVSAPGVPAPGVAAPSPADLLDAALAATDATIPPTRRAAPAATEGGDLLAAALDAVTAPGNAASRAATTDAPPDRTDRPAPTPASADLPPPPPFGVLPPEPAAASTAKRLLDEPSRFDLDQAAHVVARGRPFAELPYRSVVRLNLPAGEVAAGDVETGSLTLPTFGLLGGGALPRHYVATAAAELRHLPANLRRRGTALGTFLEILSRRFTGFWIAAGAKVRPAREPERAKTVLAAAIGMATPGLAERATTPLPGLLYHAGNLGHRTRSAERLCAMLEEEIGRPVEIVEFQGGWQRLPDTERTRLGRAHARLGATAAAGSQVWDPAARFIIRVGPLDDAAFRALLPGEPLFTRVCELTRLHVGPETDFALNPILSAAQVPAAKLGVRDGRGAQLGRTGWMRMPRPRTKDAADALLRP